MISRKIIEQIEKEVKRYFKNASGCHDWTHVERVKILALHIGRKEKADLNVLEAAALLHDVGRKEEMKSKGKFCHAEKGAEIAKRILKKHRIKENIAENVIHCIKTHRFRNQHRPDTIEAKVLYDADKLDSIGAVGVARDFLFAGNAGSNTLYTGNEKKLAKENRDYSYSKEDSAFLEYEIKLKYIKNKMLTKEGRKIALGRHRFMEMYFKRFWEEVRGAK